LPGDSMCTINDGGYIKSSILAAAKSRLASQRPSDAYYLPTPAGPP